MIAALSARTIFGFIFDTRLGQSILAGAFAVLIFSVWLVKHDHKVRQEVYETAKEVGKANNAKASKAHARARQPGSAERVLRQHCRDCD